MNDTSLSDRQLITRVIINKDSNAFGQLVKNYQSPVRNFMRKLTSDYAQADDLAQDCFLQAWKKLHTYSGEGTFLGWLMKVAYTTFLQSKRKSKRYNEVLYSFGKQEDVLDKHIASHSDEASDLEKYLSVLAEQERVVMILSYSYGLSHREISETVGLPTGSVKSIIYRCKLKIREHFGLMAKQG